MILKYMAGNAIMNYRKCSSSNCMLTDQQGKLLSDNFYWRSNKSSDYTALNKLPKASLKNNFYSQKRRK